MSEVECIEMEYFGNMHTNFATCKMLKSLFLLLGVQAVDFMHFINFAYGTELAATAPDIKSVLCTQHFTALELLRKTIEN